MFILNGIPQSFYLYIISKPLNNSIFALICEFQTEVVIRRKSFDNSLQNGKYYLFFWRNWRIYMFFWKTTIEYHNLRIWLKFLDFLINSCLQGSWDILTSIDKLLAFPEKMSVWCANLDQGNIVMLSLFTGQENSNSSVLETISSFMLYKYL